MMNLNTTSVSPLPGSPRRLPHQNLLAAAGGLLLVVAAAAAWAIVDSRESAEPTTGSAAVQPAAAPAAAIIPQAVPAGTVESTWVYIVGSEAEAALLRGAAASVPGSPSTVIVAGSRDAAEAIMNFELGLNPIREATGQGPVRAMILGALASGR